MSEVLRNYTWGGNPRKRRRDLRRRGRSLAKFVLPVLGVLVLWMFWLTRDAHDMVTFIPAQQELEIYVGNIVDRRAHIARSRVWDLVPKQTEAGRLVDNFTRELPLPEWVLNNISTGVCHISGPSRDFFDEMLIVTRMTRIGCMAERLARLAAQVRKDYAGGLRMRHIPEADLYYAVRGRILLLSFSRERLIRALTLSPEAALDPVRFQEGVHLAAGTDIYCRVDGDAWPTPESPFEQVAFALRIEPDAARLVTHATISPAFKTRFMPLFDELAPGPLAAPLDGILSISANVGMPLPVLAEALYAGLDVPHAWTEWRTSIEHVEGDLTPITHMGALLLNALHVTGPRMRLGWFGVDRYEMLPAPLVAATFDADTDALLALFERISPTTTDSRDAVDWTPRLEEEQLLAHAPLVGGPSLELTLAAYGRGLIMASSLPLALELQESPLLGQHYHQQGNVFALLKPLPAFEACYGVARELALSGLLRGYTEQRVEQEAISWRGMAEAVQDVALFAAYENNEVRTELKIKMREEPLVSEVTTASD